MGVLRGYYRRSGLPAGPRVCGHCPARLAGVLRGYYRWLGTARRPPRARLTAGLPHVRA